MSSKSSQFTVRQLRLVVEADNFDEVVSFYRNKLGLSEEFYVETENDARVMALRAGRATLEIVNPAQRQMIDALEVGRDVSRNIRVAFEVTDANLATDHLLAAGADLVAPPIETPWRTLNSRLEAPAGLQITLFEELDDVVPPLHTLRGCAEIDVDYEVDQYCLWATTAPPDLSDEHDSLRLRQATFEAAVLHHRNLAEFLHGARPKQDEHRRTNIVADHYFDAGWQSKPAPMRLRSTKSGSSDGSLRHSIDVHLAHITSERHTRRVSDGPFDWGAVDSTLVLKVFLKFVDDLRMLHPDRGEWFSRAEGEARTALARMRSNDDDVIVTTTSA